mgnify:FL=1
MGAKYCCSNADMTVIDWDKSDILNYLGTYFPRSFAEAYCIFTSYFELEKNTWSRKNQISVFDFGCGTGGEIVGLAYAIETTLPQIQTLLVKGLDGNQAALHCLETVFEELKNKINLHIDLKVSPLKIDDIYDANVIESIVRSKYDIIMTFKAICEFVTKRQFEERNPYQYLSSSFIKRLNDGGMILMEDVTTYNKTSQDWLPKMMDRGIVQSGCSVKYKNEGYNQCFQVSHSRKKNDKSKVAWRIINSN